MVEGCVVGRSPAALMSNMPIGTVPNQPPITPNNHAKWSQGSGIYEKQLYCEQMLIKHHQKPSPLMVLRMFFERVSPLSRKAMVLGVVARRLAAPLPNLFRVTREKCSS